MPERVAGHEHAETDPLGLRRDGGQQGPALQAAILGRTVGVDEVVDQPGMVEAERLSEDEVVEHLRPRPARLAQEQPEAQRRPACHHGASVSSQIVNGPSLTSSTAISAPNRPVATGTPSPRSVAAKRS